ncbi:hypothetical protein CgunFtcFv8_012208 [Champsocephalus gunnari]|uniref:Secreted protein n=1 Tax=Champsocephalus gunnari TaxID=52237 RepID=A0AAN8D631_CHAGU|nr:hypothetical protein CgunFtcFv8_012208 [Champsocephalus gunnari]
MAEMLLVLCLSSISALSSSSFSVSWIDFTLSLSPTSSAMAFGHNTENKVSKGLIATSDGRSHHVSPRG